MLGEPPWITPSDRILLRTIRKAARTVGVSLDWVDHGGGEQAWQLIHAQPGVVHQAHRALTREARGQVPQELVDEFQRHPEHAWWPLEELALELLGDSQ